MEIKLALIDKIACCKLALLSPKLVPNKIKAWFILFKDFLIFDLEILLIEKLERLEDWKLFFHLSHSPNTHFKNHNSHIKNHNSPKSALTKQHTPHDACAETYPPLALWLLYKLLAS